VIINGLQKYCFSLDYQTIEHLFFISLFSGSESSFFRHYSSGWKCNILQKQLIRATYLRIFISFNPSQYQIPLNPAVLLSGILRSPDRKQSDRNPHYPTQRKQVSGIELPVSLSRSTSWIESPVIFLPEENGYRTPLYIRMDKNSSSGLYCE